MRAYTTKIRNKEESWRLGAVDVTLLVIADDITSALMISCERCSELAQALKEAGIPNSDEVRITSISEEYANVTGNTGINYEKDSIKDRDEWAQNLAQKLKDRS